MNILGHKSANDIRKNLWERLLASVKSDDVRKVAEKFGALYINSIGHGVKAFGYDAKSEDPLFAQREKNVQELFDDTNLSTDDKVKLLDTVGMMQMLHQFAELKAAFNSDKMQEIVDKTIDALADSGMSLEQIYEHIQTVHVHRVLTAHPTFVGKLPYAVLMRNLQNALFVENSEDVNKFLAEFNAPDFTAVVDKNLTPVDEADFANHYLSGIAQDRHELYRMFDEALRRKFKEGHDPAKLKFQTRYGDWNTSGDKDGNQNITAASLAAAIPQRRKAASARFISILDKLEMPDETAALKARLNTLQTLDASEISQLRADLEAFFVSQTGEFALEGLRDVRDLRLSLGFIEFRETAEMLEHVISKFLTKADVKKLIKVDGKDYHELNDEQKSKLLNNLLAPKSIDALKAKIEKAMKAVPEKAKAADYKYKDTGKDNNAIFYNTIERLKIAAANPDMFPGQVLAEAEKPLQLKEMLVLLTALGLEKQILAEPLFEKPEILLNVEVILEDMLSDPVYYNYLVNYSIARFKDEPLFELDTELEKKLLNLNPKARSFQKDIAAIEKSIRTKTGGRYGIEDILSVEFQLAHSDNTRRGGTTTARGGIGDAHRIGNEVARKFGFRCHIYEGGSQTDSTRKGGKGFRAQLNMQGTYNFIKDTVQGIDCFVLMNGILSTTAYMGELICHGLIASKRWNGKEWITPERRRQADFNNAATPIQQIVNATGAQLQYYQDIHFAHPRLAEAMDQLFRYSDCRDAGTVGSRAGERSTVELADKKKSLATDATKVRTIGYSEAGQHAYCHFGFIGAGELRGKILKDLHELGAKLIEKSNNIDAEKSAIVRGGTDRILVAVARKAEAGLGLTIDEAFDLAFLTNNSSSNRFALRNNMAAGKRNEVETAFDNPVLKSDAELLKSLYENSPLFRDIIDRNGNAVASSTDFDKIWANAMSTDLESLDSQGRVEATVRIKRRPLPDELDEAAREKDTMRGYLAGLEIDCRKASHLVIEAMTGEPFELTEKISTTELKLKVRELMRDKGKLHAGDVMHSFADIVLGSVPESQQTRMFRTTVHNAVDNAVLHAPTPQPVLFVQQKHVEIT